MTKEDLSITYENNIFYCTKNNTKWISVDGEKWYGEEKRIAELESTNKKISDECHKLVDSLEKKQNENELLETQNIKLQAEVSRLTIKNSELKDDQLTKAKEIIRSLYFIIQGRIDYKGNIPLEDEMYRANQFLNSEGK